MQRPLSCLYLGLACLLLCGGASAQSSGNNSSSGSTASSSGSVSGTATNAGNAQTVNYNAAPTPDKLTVRSAPGVAPPSLTTTLSETCMGSTSAGLSGIAFGLSLGGTWNDVECVNRLNARELRSLGHVDAAKQVLCENKAVRAAYRKVGAPCLDDPVTPQ
jgi:hypothetical protein